MQRVSNVDENRKARQVRYQFAHQIKLFRRELVSEIRKPRHVSSRPRQTFHQSEADWIGSVRHYDRDRTGSLFEGKVGGKRRSKKDVRFELNEFDRQAGKAIRMAVGEAKVEAHVTAF